MDDAETSSVAIPFDEREYEFSVKDGTYKELLEAFSHMSGVPFMGDPPKGSVSFVSDEVMDFEEALGRIKMLFFKHPRQYWLLPYPHDSDIPDYFEIVRVTEVKNLLPLELIFSSEEDFWAADLKPNDVALLLYAPDDGTVVELDPLSEFVPDYVQVRQHGDANAVTIFGLVKDINKYLGLIEEFQVTGDDPRQIKIIQFKHVQPSEALKSLNRLMDDRKPAGRSSPRRSKRRGRRSKARNVAAGQAPQVVTIADDQHGRLLVRATPSKINEIEELLAYVDVPLTDVSHVPTVVDLEHTQASTTIDLVGAILRADSDSRKQTKTGRRSRRSKRRRSSRRRSMSTTSLTVDGLTMLAWRSSNRIVLIGDDEQVEEAQSLIKRFDEPDATETKTVVVEHQDVEILADETQRILASTGSVASADLLCIADPAHDSIILGGLAHAVLQAEELIASLDIENEESEVHLQSIKPQHLEPSALVTVLTKWDAASGNQPARSRRSKRRRRRRSLVSQGKFMANDKANILYVICSDDEWNGDYLPLIKELDLADTETEDMSFIPVEFITSREAVGTLHSVFGKSRKGRSPGATRYVATPYAVLVAGASPTHLDAVQKIIAEVDVDPEESGIEVRRKFVLENADPNQVIAAVRNVIAPKSKRRSRKSRSGGGSAVRFTQYGDTVWVVASACEMDRIAELIEELDSAGPEQELRLFEFEVGTDVTQLAQTLRQLFPSPNSAASRSRRRSKGRGRGPVAAKVTVPEQLTIIPRPTTQQIIVSAESEMIEEIEEAIEWLRPDIEEQPLVVEYVPVEHGDPETIISVVKPIVEAKLEELVATGQISQANRPTGKKRSRRRRSSSTSPGMLRINADPVGDRLIVMAPGLLMPEIVSLVDEMDRPGEVDASARIVHLQNADPNDVVMAMKATDSNRSAANGRRKTRRGRRSRGKRTRSKVTTAAMTTSAGVTVLPAPGGSSIALRGPLEQVDEVEKWIQAIDDKVGKSLTMKVYELVNSDVEELADTIMSVFNEKQPRKTTNTRGDAFEIEMWDEGGPQHGADVSLTTDPFSNTMIVWASPKTMSEIDDFISLYEGEDGGDGTLSSSEGWPKILVPLEHVDAYDASFTLESFIDVLWEGDSKPSVDYFENTLVIRSKDSADFSEIREIIAAHIDLAEADYGNRLRVHPVKGMPAEEMLEMIQERLPSLKIEIDDSEPEDVGTNGGLRRLTPDTPVAEPVASQ